jgi:hypothetical protein
MADHIHKGQSVAINYNNQGVLAYLGGKFSNQRLLTEVSL